MKARPIQCGSFIWIVPRYAAKVGRGRAPSVGEASRPVLETIREGPVRMSRVPISAVIIAYNDEPNMQACLESVTWADEIIVVDSFSTDATERISRRFTDKVYQHAFHGFGRLRNEAMSHATHDWIFSLDTDERATVELRDEISRTLAGEPDADAYFVPRKN